MFMMADVRCHCCNIFLNLIILYIKINNIVHKNLQFHCHCHVSNTDDIISKGDFEQVLKAFSQFSPERPNTSART